jgi:hypothetical protein
MSIGWALKLMAKEYKGIELKFAVYTSLGFLLGMLVSGALSSGKGFGVFVIGFILLVPAVVTVFDHHNHTETGRRFMQENRGECYIVGVLLLFALSWIAAEIVGSATYPGDENEMGQVATAYIPGKSLSEKGDMQFNMFVAMFTPTILAIRTVLGKPGKVESGDPTR